jgi:hypothetical protein
MKERKLKGTKRRNTRKRNTLLKERKKHLERKEGRTSERTKEIK